MKQDDRRTGAERRSGRDRRKPQVIQRKRTAPAVAGVCGTAASYAAAVLSEKYGVPIEVMAPVVGVVFAFLAAFYQKIVLPWME